MVNLIASVATMGATSSTGGTSAPIDTTGANLLVAWVTGWINFGVLTDSKGNIWSSLPQRNNGNNGGRWVYCTAPLVGSSHTFSLSAVNYGAWTVWAFSGVNAVQVEVWATGDNISSLASGSVTPAVDGSLVLAGFTAGNIGAVSVAPAGFSLQQTTGGVAGVNKNAGAYLVQSPAAPINPTWTLPGATFNCLAGTIVFSTGTPTAAAQLAQLPVEVIVAPNAATVNAFLAQLPLEILTEGDPVQGRVAQTAVEVMFTSPPPTVSLAQTSVEVLFQPLSTLPAKLSQVAVEVMIREGIGGVGGEKVYVFLD